MIQPLTTEQYNARIDATMSEKALQEFVRAAATQFGWLYFHVHDSRHSPSGFPDCVMVRGDRLIFAELKRQKTWLSDDQRRWAAVLTLVTGNTGPVQYFVWRPSDRTDILEVLQ